MGPEWIQEVNVSRFKRSRVLLNNTFSTWIGSKILCFEINKQTKIDICIYMCIYIHWKWELVKQIIYVDTCMRVFII